MRAERVSLARMMLSFILAGEVASGWEKVAAIAASAAVVLGILTFLRVDTETVAKWWRNGKGRRAARLKTTGWAFVGSDHTETLVVRMRRGTFLANGPSVRLSDPGFKTSAYHEIPGVRYYTTGNWTDADGAEHKFPKFVAAGVELHTGLTVVAETAWKGTIHADSWMEGQLVLATAESFEILASPSK